MDRIDQQGPQRVGNGIQNGQPDRLLGYNVWTDSNVAAQASNAKTVAFGDLSAYYIRLVGDVAEYL